MRKHVISAITDRYPANEQRAPDCHPGMMVKMLVCGYYARVVPRWRIGQQSRVLVGQRTLGIPKDHLEASTYGGRFDAGNAA